MGDLNITSVAAAKRFPGIHDQVMRVLAVRERDGTERLKLLYEWTKTGVITWPQFKRLHSFLAYIDEMGTLPETV